MSDDIFYDQFNTVNQFIKPFVEKKLSTFVEYGALKGVCEVIWLNMLFLISRWNWNHNSREHLFWTVKCWYFSYFSMKMYVVSTHEKSLAKVVLICTYNTFLWRNKKKYVDTLSYLELWLNTLHIIIISSSYSDFWSTCRYRGNIHISGSPSRELACCTHGRYHTRDAG